MKSKCLFFFFFLFSCNTNQFWNVSIPNGVIAVLGGAEFEACQPAIQVNGAENLTVEGVTFENCAFLLAAVEASITGWAMISNASFTTNVGTDGGALHITAGGGVYINGSTFDTNFANYGGGGLLLTPSLTVANSMFTSNSANFTGGAFFFVDDGILLYAYLPLFCSHLYPRTFLSLTLSFPPPLSHSHFIQAKEKSHSHSQ